RHPPRPAARAPAGRGRAPAATGTAHPRTRSPVARARGDHPARAARPPARSPTPQSGAHSARHLADTAVPQVVPRHPHVARETGPAIGSGEHPGCRGERLSTSGSLDIGGATRRCSDREQGLEWELAREALPHFADTGARGVREVTV